MSWHTLTLHASAEQLDTVEKLLWGMGALSVTIEDAADQPIFEPGPKETPVWHQNRVTALFDVHADMEALAAGLIDAGFPGSLTDELEDRVWEREWLQRFQPMRFGRRLWICPAQQAIPEESASGEDPVILHLDPGLAFGTGSHATTRLCLTWLDSQCLKSKTLLDYGCGSGVLAIAAALLGAQSVTGLDIDPQAIIASKDNANKNSVTDRIHWHLVSNEPVGRSAVEQTQVDFLVANILAQPLKDLSHQLLACLGKGGRLAMSGIMIKQASEVMAVYSKALRFDPVQVLDGWVLLSGERI